MQFRKNLAIAVLFNPLVPVRLEREVWIFIDIAICVLALTLAWLQCRPLVNIGF